MKHLEITCKFTHFSRPYRDETVAWPKYDVEFKVLQEEGHQVGHFKAWKNDVEPESIKDELARLENIIEPFALGMNYLGNYRISWEKVDTRYQYDDEIHMIRNEIDIEAIIHRYKGEEFNYINAELPRMTSELISQVQPSPVPTNMPYVPLSMKRYILTITQAMELNGLSESYADEKLKRWFLILEELESNQDSVHIPVNSGRHSVSFQAPVPI